MKKLINLAPRQVPVCIKNFCYSTSVQQQTHPTEQPSKFTSFYHKDLEVVLASPSQRVPKPDKDEELKFGMYYADHMLDVDWSSDHGWTRPIVSPLHEFRLHPGTRALHYALQQFEGLKAYRGVDNKIRLFRIDRNMERMKRTAARVCFPDFDGDELTKIVRDLVHIDKEWVPYSSTSSLYIRMAMIGTDSTLGIASSSKAKLFVLTAPVGAYYSTGFKPVTLFADPSFVRAFPGGVGSFKLGCNYAHPVYVAKIGQELGCQQVLWLFDEDEKLTEVSSMNIFVFWHNEDGELELVTPPLTDGIILPGITRESLLTISRGWNEFKVSERYPTMQEIKKALREKRMLQMFGTGTACVVSPVSQILYLNRLTGDHERLYFPPLEHETHNVMQRLYDTLSGIQYGRIPAPEGWVTVVN